ncbi:hypothetical protein [Aeromonas intestinalis]
MSFSDESINYLIRMGVNPDLYHADLSLRFNNYVKLIDSLVINFGVRTSSRLENEAFNLYIKQYGIPSDSKVFNHAYEIFNYIRMFKEHGRFGIFKGRQAEWEGPVVTLHPEDVPKSDVDVLTEGMPIYRGMSEAEFNSGQFGQSWTTNLEVAKRFAKDTYSDMPQGIVARAFLDKNNAIYHSQTDFELEVIMAPQSVVSADRI